MTCLVACPPSIAGCLDGVQQTTWATYVARRYMLADFAMMRYARTKKKSDNATPGIAPREMTCHMDFL